MCKDALPSHSNYIAATPSCVRQFEPRERIQLVRASANEQNDSTVYDVALTTSEVEQKLLREDDASNLRWTRPLKEQRRQQERTVSAIVDDTRALSTLGKLLPRIRDLIGDLDRDGVSSSWATVFLPSDTAFDVLPTGLVAKLKTSEWILHLEDLLLFHIHAGEPLLLPSDHVSTSASSVPPITTIAMANGETTQLSVGDAYDGRTMVETAVILGQERASNGQAYLIDRVMTPSFFTHTIIDRLSSPLSSMSDITSNPTATFASLIVVAEMEDVLSHSHAALTIFSPTNEAFATLGVHTMAFLKSAEGASTLQDILRYHMVSGVIASVNLAPNEIGTFQSLFNDDDLTIERSIDGSRLAVNNVEVIQKDMLAVNGIVHTISRVLSPPSLMRTKRVPS